MWLTNLVRKRRRTSAGITPLFQGEAPNAPNAARSKGSAIKRGKPACIALIAVARPECERQLASDYLSMT